MLNKLISSIVLACSFAVMPASGKSPGSLLFLFISPNKWIGTIRLAVALILFFVSFRSLSQYFSRFPKLQKELFLAGLTLIGLGLISTLESSLGTIFYDYLKPLDLMIILECGIVLTGIALSTKPSMLTDMTKVKRTKTIPKLTRKTA